MDERTVGITTTVPVEVLYAAGWTPVDLNNVFITSADPVGMVDDAEQRGFPRNTCSWIKGIYTAARRRGVDAVVAVTQGDCSNTHALMEIFQSEGMRVVDFAYPYRRETDLLAGCIERLAREFGTTLEAAETEKDRLDAVRATVHEADRLTWQTGQVTSEENFTWTINCSDFEGAPDDYGARARAFLDEAEARPEATHGLRIALLGVPPICTNLHQQLAEMGLWVVLNEMPRQFAMPGPSASLVEQYSRYTYPYDIFFRLDDVERECRRRGVCSVIHYVQSFCYRQIQDRLIRERLGLPLLTLECDRPGPLDAASRTRLEAFAEMLHA